MMVAVLALSALEGMNLLKTQTIIEEDKVMSLKKLDLRFLNYPLCKITTA